jgi:hypothetical protein
MNCCKYLRKIIIVIFLLIGLMSCRTELPIIDGNESCLFTCIEFHRNSDIGFPSCYLELKLDENTNETILKYQVATGYAMQKINSGNYESSDIYMKFPYDYLDSPLAHNHVKIEPKLTLRKSSITIYPRKIIVDYDYDVYTKSGTIKYYAGNFEDGEIKNAINYLFNDPNIGKYESIYFGEIKYLDVKKYLSKLGK